MKPNHILSYLILSYLQCAPESRTPPPILAHSNRLACYSHVHAASPSAAHAFERRRVGSRAAREREQSRRAAAELHTAAARRLLEA